MQINCSYYSAVGDRDDWYILARALQLFTPGIPLIYYVGLLAGANDLDLVEKTKTGRDINRHPYTLDEAIAATERPVVKVLFELCRFRNHHPAFNGTFELLDTVRDILDSTVLVPGTTAEGPATTPIPVPAASDAGDTGDLMRAVSGSFRAQRVSLLASLDGDDADFLADIVLDRGSIDVLASMDHGDLDDDTVWCAPRATAHDACRSCVCFGFLYMHVRLALRDEFPASARWAGTVAGLRWATPQCHMHASAPVTR